MISRRAFVASGLLYGTAGCTKLSERECIIAYTNLTGCWISGIVSIGTLINDSIASLPLGTEHLTARCKIVETKECNFQGWNCFTKQSFYVNGLISKCPSFISNPYLHILIRNQKTLNHQWIERNQFFEVDEVIPIVNQNITFRFLIWRRPENFLLAHLGIRQRPIAHGTIVGRDYRIDKGPHTELGVRWIVDPAMSSQCVFSFTYSPNQDPAHCWRIPVDFSQPQFRPHRESGNLWVETTLDGHLQIGHFETPAQSTRQLDSLLQKGIIPVPRDFVSLQALKQPFFQMPLYEQEATSQMVDLRFDDER